MRSQNDETGLPEQNRQKRKARTRHAEQDNVTGKTMQPEQTCRTGQTDRTGRTGQAELIRQMTGR
jgi:hypothetical protein